MRVQEILRVEPLKVVEHLLEEGFVVFLKDLPCDCLITRDFDLRNISKNFLLPFLADIKTIKILLPLKEDRMILGIWHCVKMIDTLLVNFGCQGGQFAHFL